MYPLLLVKQTPNYVIELGFDLKESIVQCKAINKQCGAEVFNGSYPCEVTKSIVESFKRRQLSPILKKDVQAKLYCIVPKYVVRANGTKLDVECSLKSIKTGKIKFRHIYHVTFNDLLDYVDASADDKWFKEVCM